MRSTLIVSDLFEVVLPDYIPPIDPATATTTVTSEGGVKLPDATKWLEYQKMNYKALAAIHIACSPQAYSMIARFKTAQETWTKLKSLYGTETYVTEKATYFALHDLRSDQFKDLYSYLSKFQEYTNKLEEMGHPIDPTHQVAIFERGLPTHMEGAVYTLTEIQRSKNEPIDFSYITTSLVARETSNQADNSKAYAGKFGKQPKQGSGHSRNRGHNHNNNNEKCETCGGGHPTKKCFHGFPHLAPEGVVSLSKDKLKARREASKKEKEQKSNKDKDKEKSKDEENQDKSYTARFSISTNTDTKSNEIIIDSGDQEHVFWDRTKFTDYTPVKHHTVSGPTGGKPIKVEGIGNILIPTVIDNKVSEFELTEVRHVPNIEYNLLSTTQLDLQGYTHTGGDGKKTFYDKQGQEVLQAFLHDRTYWLETMWIQQMRAFRLKSSVPAKNDASWTQWHKRYGHVSMETTKAMARATGVDCQAADRLQNFEPQELCEACVSGKITRMPSRIPMPRVTINGQAWHIDLASASHVTTLGGHTNVMVSTCEASGFTYLDHMTSRAQLPEKLDFRLKHWSNQGYKTAFIRSDNELDQNGKCHKILADNGISLTPTAPYNPHQNGISERKNRTLFSKVRAVLIDAGLPQEFWGEAIYYINYINNLIPGQDGKTPFERWYGYKPQTAYLKPFGCWCYSFDTKPGQKKLDSRAIKCRFLGHDGKSIYRV